MPTIRLSEETKTAINDLGNTFDSADDVLQRLIREAGHARLLEDDTVEKRAAHTSGQSLSAAKAKRRFRSRLENHDAINTVTKADVKGNRDGLKIITDGGTKHLWMKYSKFAGQENPDHSPFYGGTWDMTEKLAAEHPLYIVFLGQTEDSYWIVPLADFTSKLDITPDSKNGTQWRINFDQGDNRTTLAEYETLDSLLE